MELSTIQSKIFELRGFHVMFDYDLSELYEVKTKALKQAVRRNIHRFPPDFMFELTSIEFGTLRSQIVTSNRRGGTRYMPFAFTEQGVAMLSAVLNSDKAIDMNIAIIRAFVALRQFAVNYKELAQKLATLEKQYNQQFADVYQALDYLVNEKVTHEQQQQRKKIGFLSE